MDSQMDGTIYKKRENINNEIMYFVKLSIFYRLSSGLHYLCHSNTIQTTSVPIWNISIEEDIILCHTVDRVTQSVSHSGGRESDDSSSTVLIPLVHT